MGLESVGHSSNERSRLRNESSENAERVLKSIRDSETYEEFDNITEMYRALPSETLVVRRENPEQLMHLVTTGEPLSLSFVGGQPYANSVVWNPKQDGTRGIDNAFLEGYGHLDGIVTVYGFRKPDDFYFEQLPESTQIFGGIERSRVRSAAGFVPKDAIRFITVRIPLRSFPRNLMTEEELDLLWEYENEGKEGPAFVYRGFLTKDTEKAADLPMAA
ncbi:MAG TPA: hypothetical protein VGE53_00165 [Candidatus Paceibacterota bacterium]